MAAPQELTLARGRLGGSVAVVVAGVLIALLLGVALATSIPLGIALLVAVLYLPIVFLDLPVAVCLWIPIVFLEGLPAFNLASKAAGLILVLGWVGLLVSGAAARGVFARHRRLLEILGLLIVWLTLSLGWAVAPWQGAGVVWQWWAVALVFLIVATSITTHRLLELAVGMYVVGAVLAVLASTATGGTAADAPGRLASSIGDPNFLAAALVSAVPLAFALSATRDGVGWKAAAFGVVLVLVIGVVASQSRGGLAAAVAMWIAAVVVLPRRGRVLALGALGGLALVVAFTLNPTSWERVTQQATESTGRVDLWTVAWQVFQDHPLNGVGLNNFGQVAGEYVRDVGPLDDVALVVVDIDREVHNIYLQLLSENGIVGMVLFALVVLGCMRASLRAARMFDELERPDLRAVAHGLFVSTAGLLASNFFISGAVDRRIWIVLGLSLATLEIAHRLDTERATSVILHALGPPEPDEAPAPTARSSI